MFRLPPLLSLCFFLLSLSSPPSALVMAVAWTTYEFWKVNPKAGQLMLPYLAFNAFALALNKAVINLNPPAIHEEREANRTKYGKTY